MKSSQRAVVVGGINIDIGGKPFQAMISRDSNPGTVTFSLGGVGRNIAQDLLRLGVEVSFLTALGDDVWTPAIEGSCRELGLDLSQALRVPGGKNPVYLYLNDRDGDMLMAVSDMGLCDRIDPDYLASRLPVFRQAQAAAADTNIPAASLEWLADHCGKPLFVDAVSVRKAEKLRPLMDRLHTLKVNRLEAQVLSGTAIHDRESLLRAARRLLSSGTRRVFITLGSRGALAADEKDCFLAGCCPTEVVSTTGAGDAFFASLLRSFLQERSLEDTLRIASAAASLFIESPGLPDPSFLKEAIPTRAGTCRTERLVL